MTAEPQAACNHARVGVLVECEGCYLFVRSRQGIIAPTRHVDELPTLGDAQEAEIYLNAAHRALEALGLPAGQLTLWMETFAADACTRTPLPSAERLPVGLDRAQPWHKWRVYHTVIPPTAEPRAGRDNPPHHFQWLDREQLRQCASRTARYQAQRISDAEWEQRPGLTDVWIDILGRLQIL